MTITIGTISSVEIDPALLVRWHNIPVAVAIDLSGQLRQINPAIRPLCPAGSQPRLFGRAVTAQCEPPDFGAVLYAVDIVQAGDILIIAAGGDSNNAMIGEVLGGHLRAKGCAGVVCDGAIRDVATLASWDNFPVYCRAITPKGPIGLEKGAVNQPVVLGDQVISPGDLIIGDDDGLIALSAEDTATWIKAAEDRLVAEDGWVRRLKNGETMGSLFSLPPGITLPGNNNSQDR